MFITAADGNGRQFNQLIGLLFFVTGRAAGCSVSRM